MYTEDSAVELTFKFFLAENSSASICASRVFLCFSSVIPWRSLSLKLFSSLCVCVCVSQAFPPPALLMTDHKPTHLAPISSAILNPRFSTCFLPLVLLYH